MAFTAYSTSQQQSQSAADNEFHGVPPGGATGQVIKKLSPVDFHYGWGDDETGEGGGGGSALFLGTYTSLANLTLAHPAPEEGSEAHVNEPGAPAVMKAIWDNEAAIWVITGEAQELDLALTIHEAPEKPTLADNDELVVWNSVTNAISKVVYQRLLLEEKMRGFGLINLAATGAIAVDFVATVHAHLNFTAAGSITITPPTLNIVGENVTRTIKFKPNGFSVGLPAEIVAAMAGTPDITKTNFLAITYCKIDGATIDRTVTLSVK